MTKFELIARVAEAAHTSKGVARRVLDCLPGVILDQVVRDDRVSLTGLGSFYLRETNGGQAPPSIGFRPSTAIAWPVSDSSSSPLDKENQRVRRKQSMTGVAILLLAGLVWGAPAQAAGLGVDRNGNGLWDDLDEVSRQAPPHLQKVASDLAGGLQEFTQAPHGNRSLVLQSMQKVQNNLLCLLAVGGEQGGQIPMALKERIVRHPQRAQRFQRNEDLIRGETLPYDPDPLTWRQYCPQGFSFPQPSLPGKPPTAKGG